MKYVNLGCGHRFHPEWINIDMVSTGPGVIAHDLSRTFPLASGTCDVVYHSHVLEHMRRQSAIFFLSECHRILKPGGIIRIAVPDLETICRIYLEKLEGARKGDKESAKEHYWMTLELYDQAVREHWRSEMWTYLFEKGMRNDSFIQSRIGRIENQGGRTVGSGSSFRGLARKIYEKLDWLSAIKAWKIGRFRLSGEIHQWMYDQYSLGQLLRTAGFQKPWKQRADSSEIPGWEKFQLDTLPDGQPYKPDSLYMEARKPNVSQVAA
jgi:predicted SAM-dependent methyltransferase